MAESMGGFPVQPATATDSPYLSPSELFTNGEQGYWLDPSDLSTLFQDAAGTTPVTAAGQPVGRINDKSGNGYVFAQSTAGDRPIYQVDSAGYPYVDFVSSDRLLSTTNVALSAGKKVAISVGYYRGGASGTARILMIAGYGTQGGFAHYSPVSTDDAAFSMSTGGNTFWQVALKTTGKVIFSDSLDFGAATFALASRPAFNGRIIEPKVQAGTAFTTSAPNVLDTVHYIGTSNTGTTPFLGRLYGLVVVGGGLTDARRASLDNWMNTKTGAWPV